MDKFIIKGRTPLKGSIEAGGSKNSSLPILFSTLLSPVLHELHGVPELQDMESTMKMLLHFGAHVNQHRNQSQRADWQVDTSKMSSEAEAPYDLVRKMRASILCLGPLLARFGKARVSLPGGCAIGARPIDLHLMALEKLGAEVTQSAGFVEAKLPRGKRLKAAVLRFPSVSVGATENTLMAAVLADGTTKIENAAREPEIRDLCEALVSMGAHIEGAGTSTILVQGVRDLKGLKFRIPPDRIETATYLMGAHLSGGDVTIKGGMLRDLEVVLQKLEESGAEIERHKDFIRCKNKGTIRPVSLTTAPFPGFPTDLQAQWAALMTMAEGESVLEETIFENRFMHVPELKRMGARMKISGSKLHIQGQPACLEGAPVMATDLRASASLVLAAVAARGQSTIKRIYHLDRGYESMELKLRSLGADVERALDS